MTPCPERLHPRARSRTVAVPAAATGLELLGEMAGSGYRRPPLLVRRGDGQTVQVTPLLYALLEAIDGRRDHAELAEVVSRRVERLLTAEDVRFLIEAKLRPLGVLRGPDGAEPTTVRASPLLGLRLRVVVTNPRVTRRLAAPFAWLFRPAVAVPVLVAFALASWWTLFHEGLGTALEEALYHPGLILALVALTVVSAAFHELGHAAACHRGGATPGAMGAALYLVWPVFYTDVTDSYRLGRAARLRVDLGGLYFNSIFTLGSVGVWAVTGVDALLVIVPIQLLQMVRQLIPLVRFDGYHILADLVGVPDLFARIKPILLALVPGRHVGSDPNPLKLWARVVVSGWVVVVVPFLAVTLGMVVWTLPGMVASSWDSLGLQAEALGASLDGPHLDRVALGLVSIVAVALLPLSMAYLATRVLRVTTVRFWVATEHHPAPRALAMLVAVALVATAGSRWLPEQGSEPIQQASPGPGSEGDPGWDDERSEPEGLVLALQGPAEPALVSAPPRRVEVASVASPQAAPAVDQTGAGDRRLAAEPAPPAQGEPRTALEEPSTRPAWPFPFDPPPAPGAGDNHALAVNTTDGSSVVDSAFSLQWLSGGSFDQANRAYALASCVDCKTVAVAFQALIATSPMNPVIPQNLSVAVNSECDTCVTRAIAVQLAVTLEREPSDQARSEIATWWNRLDALEGQVERLSPGEIHSRLLEIRAAMLEILAPFEAPPVPSDAMAEPSGDALSGEEDTSPGDETTTDPSEEPTTDRLAPHLAVVSEAVDQAKRVTVEDEPDRLVVDGAAGDAESSDEEPTDQAPSDEEPTDQAPSDEEPTEEEPADQEPADQAPTDQAPTDQEPADQAPTDQEPTDQEPADEITDPAASSDPAAVL